jgi:hypothetical protein
MTFSKWKEDEVEASQPAAGMTCRDCLEAEAGECWKCWEAGMLDRLGGTCVAKEEQISQVMTCSVWEDEDDQEVAGDFQEIEVTAPPWWEVSFAAYHAKYGATEEADSNSNGAQGEVLARVEVGVSAQQVEVRGPVKSWGVGQHPRDCQEGRVVCESGDEFPAEEEADADLEDEWEMDLQVERPGLVLDQPHQSLASSGVPSKVWHQGLEGDEWGEENDNLVENRDAAIGLVCARCGVWTGWHACSEVWGQVTVLDEVRGGEHGVTHGDEDGHDVEVTEAVRLWEAAKEVRRARRKAREEKFDKLENFKEMLLTLDVPDQDYHKEANKYGPEKCAEVSTVV